MNFCVMHQNQTLFHLAYSPLLVFYSVKFLQWERAFWQQLCVLNINAGADLTENIYRLCVLMCMCLDHKRPHGTPESMVSEYRIWDSSFLQVFFLLPILSTGGGGVPLFPLYTEHNSCSDFNVIYGPFYTIFSVVVQNHFLKLKD